MISRDEICAALVRAYCSVINQDKPVDVDLVDEMATEVMEAINRALERQLPRLHDA